jgi:PAS domain S-box-containing protein
LAFKHICVLSKTFAEAEKALVSNSFDFIVLDLNLPDAFGEQLVNSIQKLSDAKIFVLTVEKDLELREALYRDGVLDYLIKDKYFDHSAKSMLRTMDDIQNNHVINILTIDDSKYMREQIKKILQVRNYNVLTAENAETGIKLLKIKNPNIIVLDMELPDKSGLSILRELKFDEKYENIPIIVLSGSSTQEMVRECLKLGAFDFLKKPFNIEEFTLKINLAVLLNKKGIESRLDKNRVEDDLAESSLVIKEYQDAINKSNILSKTDRNHNIIDVNEKFCKITGYSKNKILGKKHDELTNMKSFSKVYKAIIKTIEKGDTWAGKLTQRNQKGNLYYTETTVMPIYDKNSILMEYLWMSSDITKIMSLHYEIEDRQKEMIYKMGEIAESRSEETSNHVKRVAEYSKYLALLCGLDDSKVYTLFYASPMHDIGKVAIPDAILKKPSKLTSQEWTVMKTHTDIGYYLFKNSRHSILIAAATVAYEHHEKWDGSGYPQGLKGENIHIYGRITAIVDVFDALLSERVYKKAWEKEDVRNYFELNAGTHFDPSLVQIFLNNFDDFIAIKEHYED